LDGAAAFAVASAPCVFGWPIGVGTVAVDVNAGSVVVGEASAVVVAGEKASIPTTATQPTRAAGAAYRALSIRRIPFRIYLSRKRQA
jgi:hypothetical protein